MIFLLSLSSNLEKNFVKAALKNLQSAQENVISYFY